MPQVGWTFYAGLLAGFTIGIAIIWLRFAR
jgi:hypothetical protein